MSICIIQERGFPNFKATLWAATVQIKRIPNAEFGVRNAGWAGWQSEMVIDRDRRRQQKVRQWRNEGCRRVEQS
jgi:hypothetical protein